MLQKHPVYKLVNLNKNADNAERKHTKGQCTLILLQKNAYSDTKDKQIPLHQQTKVNHKHISYET